ncbi:MAG TPA: hypothetical protein VK203_07345 [Nostocaceae cyanobacterium]|nr:hypothetical protein [Nostocaceae cyanobacterium]
MVFWKESFAHKLKAMRGKMSRRTLAQQVQERYGYSVSQQYIQLLETPTLPKAPQSVSFQLLRYICEILERDVQDLFDSPKIIY